MTKEKMCEQSLMLMGLDKMVSFDGLACAFKILASYRIMLSTQLSSSEMSLHGLLIISSMWNPSIVHFRKGIQSSRVHYGHFKHRHPTISCKGCFAKSST